MTVRITAFEGSGPGRHVASWGAAALEVDGQFWNAVTGTVVSDSEMCALWRGGRVAPVPLIQLGDDVRSLPIFVVRLVKSEIAKICIAEFRRRNHSALGRSEDESSIYFAFANYDSLQRAAECAVTKLVGDILERWGGPREEVGQRIQLGLILCSGHPELNAVWSQFDGSEAIRRMAWRHASATADGAARFDALCASLARGEPMLKFDTEEK